ncbi:hypothetical protein BDR03DRAFT_282399 [Suillus americanus]|nr:hypothetical protein BDR03DRAFT_282399 [Suillus americanus]
MSSKSRPKGRAPPAPRQTRLISEAHSELYQIYPHQSSHTVQASIHERHRISHWIVRHYAVEFTDDMSDIGIYIRAPEPCGCWLICQRWRCMRVARIARIMNWKLYVGVLLIWVRSRV